MAWGITVSDTHSRNRWGLIAIAALLTAFAAFESGTALANDDFGYLMWGLQTRDDLLAWVSGPDWFTYRRPMNTLLWWLSAQTGLDGGLVRWSQVALWVSFGATLLTAARTSKRAMVTLVLLLLTNQVFVDLLQWRSWLTTTGSLAFVALAAMAMERRSSAVSVALLGAVALGFKEVGALAVAVIALSRPGYRAVGGFLLVAVCASASSSTQKLGLSFIGDNIRFHVETVALFLPAVPVLLAARFPRLPAWSLAAPVILLVLPTPIRAGAVVVTAGLFLLSEARWLPAAAVTMTLPLLGAAHARQYLLESWSILLFALTASKKLPMPPVVGVTMLVLAAPSAINFEGARSRLRDQFATQRAFLRDFHPPQAAHLYHPEVAWSWDLDALYWVQGGATLDGRPPVGTEPVQVGPLSGVWADVRPVQGSGSK
ncbi:hypothetical protein LBMAG42_03340 [Deltaproteobacteria bacterium]|nr:hypothetical protein LBMAG42_03340 [Deltaproteobacteria bacterium]